MSLESEISVRDFLVILRKWAWLIGLALVVGAIMGWITSLVMKPVYQASTKILVSKPADDKTNDYVYLTGQQLAYTYIQLLTTEPVLQAAGSSLNYAIDDKKINAQLVRNTMLIQVDIEDNNPQVAASIANTLVKVLIDQNEKLQASRYAASEDSLQVQLKQMETQISSLQKEIALVSEESRKTQQAELKTQIDSLQAEIVRVQNEINSIAPLSNPKALETLSVDKLAELQQKKLQAEQMQSQLGFLQRTYLDLSGVGTSDTNKVDSAQLEQMRSNLALYQQIYTNLLSNYETVRLARLRSSTNIFQVESASTPEEPIRPKPLIYSLLGALSGLVLSSGALIMIEYMDDTLKTPDDINRVLKLPVIGFIQEMEKTQQMNICVAEEPRSPVAEAFRSLRTNLEFSEVDKDIKVILITSAGPSEGKTTVAVNLAMVMAQSGKRVIVVDADLRKPQIHRYLNVPNRVGLSDIFLNHRTIQAVTRVWRGTSLSAITSGSIPPNPAELLASTKMVQILDQLKEQADVIVLDSPPFMVTDPFVLAGRVDGVILVVYPGHTHADAARVMKDQLERGGARLLGVTMNRIPRNRNYYYGGYRHYSPYYYRDYSDYYEEKSNPKKKNNRVRMDGGNGGNGGHLSSPAPNPTEIVTRPTTKEDKAEKHE